MNYDTENNVVSGPSSLRRRKIEDDEPIFDPYSAMPLSDLCRPLSAKVMPRGAPGESSKGGALAIQRRGQGSKAAAKRGPK